MKKKLTRKVVIASLLSLALMIGIGAEVFAATTTVVAADGTIVVVNTSSTAAFDCSKYVFSTSEYYNSFFRDRGCTNVPAPTTTTSTGNTPNAIFTNVYVFNCNSYVPTTSEYYNQYFRDHGCTNVPAPAVTSTNVNGTVITTATNTPNAIFTNTYVFNCNSYVPTTSEYYNSFFRAKGCTNVPPAPAI